MHEKELLRCSNPEESFRLTEETRGQSLTRPEEKLLARSSQPVEEDGTAFGGRAPPGLQ